MTTMRFIIKIAGYIRTGCYPRVDQFVYSHEFEAYVYLGRALDVDEFNAAAARVFHPDFRGQGFTFCPVANPKSVTAPAPVIEAGITPSEVIAANRFRFVGTDIYDGDDRVGGLFEPGNHLRVAKGRSDLRPALEQWLESQLTKTS